MKEYKTNAQGLELIKRFEGPGPMKGGKHQSYLCPAGYWTIGFGSTYLADGTRVSKATKAITTEEAEELLALTLGTYEGAVTRAVKVPLTDNQFSALVCFVYNVGEANFKSSTLVKQLNAGDFLGAAEQFMRWDKARVNGNLVSLRGLTNRRNAERQLFLS